MITSMPSCSAPREEAAQPLRRAVRRDHARVARDPELVERLLGAFITSQSFVLPIRIATRGRAAPTRTSSRGADCRCAAARSDRLCGRARRGTSRRDPRSASTALCGIVLHPAGHTRSPAMHNAAYRGARPRRASTSPSTCRPAALAAAIAGVGARSACASSRSRFRTRAADARPLDEVDETARRIGAVNTVMRRDGAARRIQHGLARRGARARARDARSRGERAVVLGAGGTARAVVFGLLERGARVRVLNRTLERARGAGTRARRRRRRSLDALAATPLRRAREHDLRGPARTTPRRSRRADSARDRVVLDAVYEPERRACCATREARGARTVSGQWMLVHQAAAQLEAWAGLRLARGDGHRARWQTRSGAQPA